MEEAPLQLLWVLRHWSLIYCWQFNIWMSPTCFHRKIKCIFEQNFKWFLEKSLLTHYSLVLLFFTPWIHQKTFRFPDVFRGYRKATPGCNGLIGTSGAYRRCCHRRFLHSQFTISNIWKLIPFIYYPDKVSH